MVATCGRRLGGIVAVLAAALVGCGAVADPGADRPPTAEPVGSVEADVCARVNSTTGGLLIGLFLDNIDAPTPQSTARLRAGVARYADVVRAEARRTTDPTLRPVLDRAVAAAEAAAGVTSVDELRLSPFKDATLEVGRACRRPATGVPAPLPTTDPAPAAGSTELGTACELPVTFRIPAGWEPEAIDTDPAGELFDYYTVGPFLNTCDIDARSTGSRGSLYVATAPSTAGDPRSSLAAYLADAGSPDVYEVRRPTYTDVVEVTGLPAAEARFTQVGEGRVVDVTVCVVAAPDGLVLLRTNASHNDRVPAILAGYELAKHTLRPA